VSDKSVPCFSSVELSKLDKACLGSAFAQRRDAAILAVFRSTGIRLTEMARIRHHPDDLDHGDVDLGRREIYVRARAARTGSSGSTARRPAGSTATSVPGRSTRGPTTRGCGSAPATGGR
jgi:site-specific recombinase XerC